MNFDLPMAIHEAMEKAGLVIEGVAGPLDKWADTNSSTFHQRGESHVRVDWKDHPTPEQEALAEEIISKVDASPAGQEAYLKDKQRQAAIALLDDPGACGMLLRALMLVMIQHPLPLLSEQALRATVIGKINSGEVDA